MKKLALLIVECAVLLGLLEVAIRAVVAPQIDVPHLRVDAHGFYTWYPNSRFTYHNLPHVDPPSAAVRVNAEGLRGPALPAAKPADERRVLVIGDSFTAAVQLPEAEIFTTLLESELNSATAGARYRVINAGVNGAGTAHELLYFLHAGTALAPDVVVLQYAWNDIADNRAHGGFRLTDDTLVLRDDLRSPPFWRAPLLAVRDALGNRSLAFYLLYRALEGAAAPAPARAAESTPGTPAAAAVANHADAAPTVDEQGVALVVRLAGELIRAANDGGAPVVVLTIPVPIFINGGDPTYERVVAGLRALVDGTPNQVLVADPFLFAATGRGEAPFLANDGHLSAAGHRVIADALAPAVRRYETPAPH